MRLFEYSFRRTVVILVFIQNVASVPTYGVSNLFSRSLEPRDTDYEDFSWLRYWATLGDSYAAGIGAGSKIDKDCARYDRSYSYFMSIDDRLGTNQYREWQNLACSGATTEDIVANQIPSLANVQDVITLSAGGNDVGLSTILNNCVFRWWPFGASCESTIEETKAKINDLGGKLDSMLNAAISKLDNTNSRIYYVGYAQFFNAQTTQCNSVTFKFWRLTTGELLTQERRAALNDLVVKTNDQIKAAVERAGDRVIYVDTDPYFSEYGGLYCDEGVTEPDPNRGDLLFYERNTQNSALTRRQEGTVTEDDIFLNGTFEGDVANWIEDTLEQYPDWKSELEDGIFEELNNTSVASLSVTLAVENIDMSKLSASSLPRWLIKDETRRVFHPRENGHAVIANLVFYHMIIEQMLALGIDVGDDPEESSFDTCPIKCPNPSGCPTCSDNSVSYVPAQLKDPSHGTLFDPNGLIIMMRQASCTNECSYLPDLPMGLQTRYQNADKTDCEIAIALPNNVEAWVYRGTPSTGLQWQDCWDSFMNITNWCIRKGPNNGWVNGPDTYQYYQAGFRPINDKSALHEPLDPTYHLLDTNPPPPDTTGWQCKEKCPTLSDEFTINWCIDSCKCKLTNGGISLSCPLK